MKSFSDCCEQSITKFFSIHQTIHPSVVYLDKLWGAFGTQTWSKFFFLPFFIFFVNFKYFQGFFAWNQEKPSSLDYFIWHSFCLFSYSTPCSVHTKLSLWRHNLLKKEIKEKTPLLLQYFLVYYSLLFRK